MPLSLRYLTSWKPWFYRVMLPALGCFGPERCDAALTVLGRLSALQPGRTRTITGGLARAQRALGTSWDLEATRKALAGNLARFAARDCILEGLNDEQALARFQITGGEALQEALARGRGAILLGCHFGAHLAVIHWLVRQRLPVRLMVQRPRHVSRELAAWFDHAGSSGGHEERARHPQSRFFLRRQMPPGEGVLRVLRARSALQEGMAVYVNGDVVWDGGCARPGRWFGYQANFQSAWADLAVVTGAPVLPIFGVHRPGGRFELTIDPPWTLRAGEQQSGVDRFLRRLEAMIAAEPAEAIAYLTSHALNDAIAQPSPQNTQQPMTNEPETPLIPRCSARPAFGPSSVD